MSYCVNCGVELEASQTCCPLCQTPVVNPRLLNQPPSQPPVGPYPQIVERVLHTVDRRYGAILATIALCIPVVCSALIDLLITHRLSWSGYVTGGAACIFVWVLLPLLMKQPQIYWSLFFDTVILVVYLADVLLLNRAMPAFWGLALPLSLAAWVVAFASAFVLRSRRLKDKLYRWALLPLLLALFCVAVEFVVDRWLWHSFRSAWSLIVAAPCLVVSLLLWIVERKKDLKDKILRRLFL